MSAVTREGDMNTGHGTHPPVPLITGSPNVFINGLPCGRQTDTYSLHVDPLGVSPHTGHISKGSSTVFVNGLPIARVGDSVSCGGTVAQGSPNVFAK